MARSARERGLTTLKTAPGSRLADRRAVRQAVGEMEIRLATSRALADTRG